MIQLTTVFDTLGILREHEGHTTGMTLTEEEAVDLYKQLHEYLTPLRKARPDEIRGECGIVMVEDDKSMKNKLFNKALIFATRKHANTIRRNGNPYIIHPIRVSQEVFTENQKAIALLHDVLEDTETTYEELKEEFGSHIADTVLVLTHKKDEPYMDYIARVKTNDDAIAVKIADISDNLNDSPTEKAIWRSAESITYLLS